MNGQLEIKQQVGIFVRQLQASNKNVECAKNQKECSREEVEMRIVFIWYALFCSESLRQVL